ncbi:zinc metallopeptidase [Thalassolituus sp.]|uniref:zinc metallopeptidase n=1 Tax=Thalassolituus sp. TaxID=2030822 RepID=UPI002604ED77|nr:zinc metallopeptidase [uncultured Thalassolituus sp.]TNC84004.1 MAG: peptidase [Thalassolituus sp.]
MLPAILAVLLLLGLMILPQFWIKYVLNRHSRERSDFPGTGGDMARHLLGLLDIPDVKVEVTDMGDHYDPSSKAVRLTEDKLDGRTLTGVVVAAHEVGHAIQHHQRESMFGLRSGLGVVTTIFSRAAPVLLVATPLLVWLNPAFSRWALIAAVVSMVLSVLLNLVTLPVEWDASFGKALPLLENGRYLDDKDMRAARQILMAAALTYVAGSLASLVNLGVLARVLRR